jgi:hypothetical protein
MIQGQDEYTPVAVDTYRSKLRSSTQTQTHQQSASHSTRQTPRCLRVNVSPDDQQQNRLEDDDVAVLRWDVVRHCIGSIADSVKTG